MVIKEMMVMMPLDDEQNSNKANIFTKRKQKHAKRLVETCVGDLQEKEVCGNVFVNTKGKCRKLFLANKGKSGNISGK